MMEELHWLREFCEMHCVQLRAGHLPSVVSLAADRLSWSRDSTACTLSDEAFECLEAAHGPHALDLFATILNRKCERFFSATANPGTAGVDAMAHPWQREISWANPSFQLVGPALEYFLRSRATTILVVPVWRAQPC